MVEKDVADIFEDLVKNVRRDHTIRERGEEYQRDYGTLNEDDLKKIYTI